MVKAQKRKLVLWVMIGLALVILTGNHSFWRLVKAYREKAGLEKTLSRLTAENQTLRQQIYVYEHDDNAIEKLAREELGLTKEGEIEYRVKKATTK